MVSLQKFDTNFYADLISWVDNEEQLMQFAGPEFTFPLTNEQLAKSLADKNRYPFRVVNNLTNTSIGHCEIYLTDQSAYFGRILIADKAQRGKGLGQQIVNLLLDFVFLKLNRATVQLNVFDWNVEAIMCYKKVGFTIKMNGKLKTKFGLS
jgi:RimJ/RimL family protein N-acetyltransferase